MREKTEGACRNPSSSCHLSVSAHAEEERPDGKSAERGSAARCSLEDSVTTETLSASGAAGVGVSHKENQTEAQNWHFAIRSPVDGQGRFTAEVQDEALVGLNVLGAGEAAVVERLKRRNALVAEVSTACSGVQLRFVVPFLESRQSQLCRNLLKQSSG